MAFQIAVSYSYIMIRYDFAIVWEINKERKYGIKICKIAYLDSQIHFTHRIYFRLSKYIIVVLKEEKR